MKKKYFKTAVAILLFLSTTAFAAEAQINELPISDIKTVGFLKNEPVYELSIKNTALGRYSIIITDEYGVPMYEESMAGAHLNFKFMLNKAELGNTGIIVTVFNGKNVPATYFIKNNRIYTESAVVTVKK